MFAKQQTVWNFKRFLSCIRVKSKSSVRYVHLDFGPYSNILINVMEYLAAGGPVVNSPNVYKGITTLTTNINLNSYMENVKNRTL